VAYFLTLWLIVTVALMNLVTAIIVENAMAKGREDNEERQNHVRKVLKKILPEIAEVFDSLDVDRSGSLAIDELANATKSGTLIIPEDIKDFDISLCDTQPGQFWGAQNEFFSAPRLDNQVHCFTATRALVEHAAKQSGSETAISMIVCFDHEEVGSDSLSGAGSPVMQEAVERVSGCFARGDEEMHKVSIRKSFLLSADTAHAVHPNYAGKHEPNHMPMMNKGTTIKSNENQRYATNVETGFMLREIARQGGVGVQEFVVKNDCPCGSTIGPIISSKTGIRCVDIGVPILSMHSIRETMGVADVMNSLVLFKTFFAKFRALDDACVFS